MAVPPADYTVTTDWRAGLPLLASSGVILRELRVSDAPALFAMISSEEVSRFISPPPTSVEGFEKFISWTHRQRAAGKYVCFAVIAPGTDTAVGLFQVRALEPGFATAEWGFARVGHWEPACFSRARGSCSISPSASSARTVWRARGGRTGRQRRAAQARRRKEGILRRSFLRHGEYLTRPLVDSRQDGDRRRRSGPDVGPLGLTRARLPPA